MLFRCWGGKNSVTHKFYNQDNYTSVMKEAYKHFQVKGNEKNLSLADLPLKTGWRKFLRRKGCDQVVNSHRQEGESGSGRNRKRSRCDRPSFPHEFCNPVRCLKQRCLRLTRNKWYLKVRKVLEVKLPRVTQSGKCCCQWVVISTWIIPHIYIPTYAYTCIHVYVCTCINVRTVAHAHAYRVSSGSGLHLV